jgi:type II secretory pathway pseudopilin PulG
MNWKLLNRVWHANLGMAAAITLGLIAISCPFIAHKGGDLAIGKALMKIHYGEFLPPDSRWIWIDSQGLLLLFLVGSGVLMHRKAVKKAANVAADDPAVPGSSVTLIDFGPGPRGIALATEGEKRGLRLFRCGQAGLDKLSLSNERWVVVLPGDEGYSATQLEALNALCHQVKPGSAKRLQFAVADGAGADAVRAALTSAGGQPMKLAEGAFEEGLLGHLSAQSEVLKKAVKKAAPATPMPAAKPATAGFTLVETLASLGVIAVLIASGAKALQQLATTDRIASAAREFESLVLDARDIAQRENTWVRVALLPAGKEEPWLQRGDRNHPRTGAALFVLRRPALEASGVDFGPATRHLEGSSLQESAPASLTVLPPSLQAGWENAPGHPTWSLWDSSVTVDSSILHQNVATSPWLVRAAEQADFPSALAQTPLRSGYSLTAAAFLPTDKFDNAAGDQVTATEVWGAVPVKRWLENGVSHFEADVPAFDISPSGAVVGSETASRLTFTFGHSDDRKNGQRTVIVQTSTGDCWVE